MKKFINTAILAGLVTCSIAPVQASVMDTIKSKMAKTCNTLTSRTAISLYALVTAGACIYAYKVLCPDSIKECQQHLERAIERYHDLDKEITKITELNNGDASVLKLNYPMLMCEYRWYNENILGIAANTNNLIEQTKESQLLFLYMAKVTGTIGITVLISEIARKLLYKETPAVNPE